MESSVDSKPKYWPSFDISQVEEYKAYFEENGFVVVDNVLNKDECQETIQGSVYHS
jgi:hypothetical protein